MKKIVILITIIALLLGTFTMSAYAADGDLKYPGDGGHSVEHVYSHGAFLNIWGEEITDDISFYMTPGAYQDLMTRVDQSEFIYEKKMPTDGFKYQQIEVGARHANGYRFAGYKYYFIGEGPLGTDLSKENPRSALYPFPRYFEHSDDDHEILYVNNEFGWDGTYYVYLIYEPLIYIDIDDNVEWEITSDSSCNFISEAYAPREGLIYSQRYGSEFNLTYKLKDENRYVFENKRIGIYPNTGSYDEDSVDVTELNKAIEIQLKARLKQHIVKFDANGAEGTMEDQVFSYGETQTLNEPTAFYREGYQFAGWNTEPDGSGTSYSDGHRLTFEPEKDGETSTLYAQWKTAEIDIMFNHNAPENTESMPSPDGNMDPVHVSYEDIYQIPDPEFTLKGYEFICWNTRTDRAGISYYPRDSVTRLTSDYYFPLYAQWEPFTYQISFDANGGTGTMSSQRLNYDQVIKLPANTFTAPYGMTFAGWKIDDGTVLEDEAEVVNLCKWTDDDSLRGYTLVAQWVNNSVPTVVVGKNGGDYEELQVTLGKDLLNQGSAADLTAKENTPGVYELDASSQMADGEYYVWINGHNTGKKINVVRDQNTQPNEGDNFALLNYYSVSLVHDENIESVTLAHEGNAPSALGKSENTLEGEILEISAVVEKEGYKFSQWVPVGCDPEFVDSSATDASAKIKIKEKTILKAVSEPIRYDVKFDANVPENASAEISGTMENQTFTYDKAGRLKPNAYQLEGYTFAGWNTKADGSGMSYQNEKRISNLTKKDGETITLYAQWEPNKYEVVFDGNWADFGNMAPVDCMYETTVEIPDCGYVREDHHFIGWNTKADGTGTSYKAGDKVKNLTAEPDWTVKLYAIWEHDFYTVKFNPGEATGEVGEKKVQTGENVKLENLGFKKDGYEITGWNTKPKGIFGEDYDIDEMVTDLADANETVTLYAQWEPRDYEITFDANGGSGTMDPQQMTYDELEKLIVNQFEAPEGKEFAGWKAVDSNDQTEDIIYADEEEVVNQCQFNSSGDVIGHIMVAQWKDIPNADNDTPKADDDTPLTGNDTPKADDDLPATGDDSPLGLALAIMLASIVAMVTIARKRKQNIEGGKKNE